MWLAGLAAISGWLYAHLQRFVNPTPFNLNIGIEYLFMAVVGGAGHLWGAVLGATLITLLKEQLQDWLPRLLGSSGNFEVIVFGLLMLFVLQRFADGLWPTLARSLRRFIKPHATPLSRVAPVPLAQRSLPPAGQVLLEACSVSKRFGGLVANNAVTMDLKAGEVHALIGPNGAGKSTFFKLLTGQTKPSSGQILFRGQDISNMQPHEPGRLGIGIKTQVPSLFNGLSVWENVWLSARRTNSKQQAERITRDTLERVANRLDSDVATWISREGWVETGVALGGGITTKR
mgnify:CR=1 FL=1